MPDSRSPAEIGRVARLELTFERRGPATRLSYAYAEPPLRVGRTFTIDDASFAILVCAGPGVFGGDDIDIAVRVGRGARAVLTSQAALQAHPSSSSEPARIRQRYEVEEDGELHCEWDPLIPFAGARVDQRFEICAAGGARVYWSDALMAGRAMRGETWRFDTLSHELRYRHDGKPTYTERYRLTPADRCVARRWAAGLERYFSTVLVDHPAVSGAAGESLHRAVTAVPGVRAAADLVEPGLIVGRVTAVSGPPFAAARAALRVAALDRIFDNPRLTLRK